MGCYHRILTSPFLVWGLLSIFQHAMGAFLPANGLSARNLLNSKGGRQPGCVSFHSSRSGCRLPVIPLTTIQMSQDDENSNDDESEQPIIETTVRIDDGGSNLTNRFKYKVHALMGTFDPKIGEDDERQGGHILNAMLEFPVRYTFNSVGKTGGDSQVQAAYVDAVKKVMQGNSGSDGDMVCQVTPRGTKFIKVKCEVEVHSAGMINLIYDELGKIDNTVMKF